MTKLFGVTNGPIIFEKYCNENTESIDIFGFIKMMAPSE